MTKVTIKFYQNVLYVWPDNMIRQVCIVNGKVHPLIGRREYYGSTAWALLGRMDELNRKRAIDGMVMVVDGDKLLDGLTSYGHEKPYYGGRVERQQHSFPHYRR